MSSESTTLIERLLPPRLDNDYRGHPVALWLFVPITIMTLGRSLVHILKADGGAQSIATIPLDAMTPGGSATVILIFALWGLSQLLLGLVFAISLWRYRALVPFLYLLIFAEYAGRFALGLWKPMLTLETPPGATANLVFMIAAPVLLMLALGRRTPADGHTPAADST